MIRTFISVGRFVYLLLYVLFVVIVLSVGSIEYLYLLANCSHFGTLFTVASIKSDVTKLQLNLGSFTANQEDGERILLPSPKAYYIIG